MLVGIAAGLKTCAFLGLTFLTQRAVVSLTEWDLTIARYRMFGSASLVLMVDRRCRSNGIARLRLVSGLLLCGAGYVGYFICAAFAAQLNGQTVPPVIGGNTPFCVIDSPLTPSEQNRFWPRSRCMDWF